MSTPLIRALNAVVTTQLDLLSTQFPILEPNLAPLKAALDQLNVLHAQRDAELRELRPEPEDPKPTKRRTK